MSEQQEHYHYAAAEVAQAELILSIRSNESHGDLPTASAIAVPMSEDIHAFQAHSSAVASVPMVTISSYPQRTAATLPVAHATTTNPRTTITHTATRDERAKCGGIFAMAALVAIIVIVIVNNNNKQSLGSAPIGYSYPNPPATDFYDTNFYDTSYVDTTINPEITFQYMGPIYGYPANSVSGTEYMAITFDGNTSVWDCQYTCYDYDAFAVYDDVDDPQGGPETYMYCVCLRLEWNATCIPLDPEPQYVGELYSNVPLGNFTEFGETYGVFCDE
jgi:hypothetical protein